LAVTPTYQIIVSIAYIFVQLDIRVSVIASTYRSIPYSTIRSTATLCTAWWSAATSAHKLVTSNVPRGRKHDHEKEA
jgi:hypothetical protein